MVLQLLLLLLRFACWTAVAAAAAAAAVAAAAAARASLAGSHRHPPAQSLLDCQVSQQAHMHALAAAAA
jgi:hypothetical protein